MVRMPNALDSAGCQRAAGSFLGNEHAGIINQRHSIECALPLAPENLLHSIRLGRSDGYALEGSGAIGIAHSSRPILEGGRDGIG